MALKTSRWDITEFLDSEEMIAEYLNQIMADGDPAELRAALMNVAKARGMTQVAAKAGIGRQALYAALGDNGNPTLKTLKAVLKAIGLELRVTSAATPAGKAQAQTEAGPERAHAA